jgi:hypothetical protein
VLRLAYRPPLAWDRLLGFLAARAIPGVEQVAGDTYRRTIEVGGALGAVEVWPAPGEAHLLARIDLPHPSDLLGVVERLRRLFDLGADPREITSHLGRSPTLATRVGKVPGLLLPGAWDPFELAVRAVLGQQVSVSAATRRDDVEEPVVRRRRAAEPTEHLEEQRRKPAAGDEGDGHGRGEVRAGGSRDPAEVGRARERETREPGRGTPDGGEPGFPCGRSAHAARAIQVPRHGRPAERVRVGARRGEARRPRYERRDPRFASSCETC